MRLISLSHNLWCDSKLVHGDVHVLSLSLYRTAKMILQFTDGMNAFGKLWDLVRKNWIAFLPLFTNMQEPMSKAAFKALFSYNYSRRGSNHREAEEDTIYCWEMVLNMIEGTLYSFMKF